MALALILLQHNFLLCCVTFFLYKMQTPAAGVDASSKEKAGWKTSAGSDGDGVSARRGSMLDATVEHQLYEPGIETTKRGLKSRHAQMIALGGSIGTG